MRGHLAILLPLVVPVAPPENPVVDYVPCAVWNGGWPVGVSGLPREVLPVRFGSAAETDLVLLVDDELILAYHPARYEQFLDLGQGVQAVAAIPLIDGSEGLLVTCSAGLVLRRWDPSGQGVFIETLIDDSWTNVDALWVHDLPQGGQRVLGYDSLALDILRYDVFDETFIEISNLIGPAEVRDVHSLEFSDEYLGEELFWRLDDMVLITSGDAVVLLEYYDATPNDSISVLRGAGPGGEDMVAWVTYWNGQHHVAAWSDTFATDPYPLGPEPILDMLVYDQGDDPRPDIVLPIAGSTDAHVVQVRGTTQADYLRPTLWGDRIDTTEANEITVESNDVAGAADWDHDGDVDLIVVRDDTLFFVNSYLEWEESYRLRSEAAHVPSLTDLGSQLRLDLPMGRASMAGMTTFDVEVYVEAVPGGGFELVFDDDSYSMQQQSPPLPFTFTFDTPLDLDEPDTAVYWTSFTGTEDLGGALRRYPTRLIGWSPEDETSGDRGVYPVWRYMDDFPMPDPDDDTGDRKGNRLKGGGGT